MVTFQKLLVTGLMATTLEASSYSAPSAPAPDCPPTVASPTPEQFRNLARDAGNHGFLWRISRQGHSSYLYGTIHAARPEWMVPGPEVVAALKATDTVALELNVLDPDIMRRLMTGMREPSAPLPPALHQRLLQRIRAECLPEAETLSYFPEMRVSTLLIMVARREGIDPSYGIDVFLAGLAQAGRKDVVSLETPEQQLQLMRKSTPAETTTFVSEGLDVIESGAARTTLVKLAQAWADSDLTTLSQYETWCDCIRTEADRTDMKKMLDERNPALATGIAALHDSGKRVFAAIGSLHMIGPKGLPALLARQGFEVTPLLPAPSPGATPPKPSPTANP